MKMKKINNWLKFFFWQQKKNFSTKSRCLKKCLFNSNWSESRWKAEKPWTWHQLQLQFRCFQDAGSETRLQTEKKSKSQSAEFSTVRIISWSWIIKVECSEQLMKHSNGRVNLMVQRVNSLVLLVFTIQLICTYNLCHKWLDVRSYSANWKVDKSGRCEQSSLFQKILAPRIGLKLDCSDGIKDDIERKLMAAQPTIGPFESRWRLK